MKMIMNDVPPFVKREVDKLEETVEPIAKKAAKYSFWSFPLIVFSLINLFFLLFVIQQNNLIAMAFYAVLGAIGLALSKEVRYQRKELMERTKEYIIKRIHQSEDVTPEVKNKYIQLVKQHPFRSFQYFVEFLEEEHRMSRLSYF
ncbi:DUF5392 family protein [Bacillaceae bacterium S4-13-58]